jgi:hypothetical protein
MTNTIKNTFFKFLRKIHSSTNNPKTKKDRGTNNKFIEKKIFDI